MRAEREFTFRKEDFKFIASLIMEQTGIELRDQKFEMMYSRLARRIRELKLRDFADYIDLIKGQGGSSEISYLVNAMTTNLTKFFREDHQLKHLARVVVPQILKDPTRQNDRSIKIWSAGCSSGQEPYSLAMVMDRCLAAKSDWKYVILATDIDTKMLDTASRGVYREQDVESLPENFRKRFTAKNKDGMYEMDKRLKANIHFKRLNLIKPWPIKQPFDVIFCRNVVIYFDGPTKMDLVNRFAKHLKPKGMLYMGHSESLTGATARLEPFGRASFRRVES